MKLNKKGKLLVTIITLVISVWIYSITGTIGELAQNNIFYQALCVTAWLWLVFGQMMIYLALWED